MGGVADSQNGFQDPTQPKWGTLTDPIGRHHDAAIPLDGRGQGRIWHPVQGFHLVTTTITTTITFTTTITVPTRARPDRILLPTRTKSLDHTLIVVPERVEIKGIFSPLPPQHGASPLALLLDE